MTTAQTITAYLRAIESHDPDELARWLHPDVAVIEHPNKLNPNGQRYGLAEVAAASERGRAILASERYDVRGMIVDGARASVQSTWTGQLRDGRTITAEICSIIEIRDGKIWRQEQYDCFAG